jgi:hypothetical protein
MDSRVRYNLNAAARAGTSGAVAVGVADRITDVMHSGAEKVGHAVGEKTAAGVINSGAIAGGVGVTAAISVLLSQMEYENKKREVRNLLRDELGASLGKAPEKVKVGDLERIAQSNHTVAEHLEKSRKDRNVNVGTIFLGTLAAVGVVLAASTGVGALVGGLAYAGAASMGINLVIATVAYAAAKKPLDWLADKVFDIDRKTTFDRIEAIHHDHAAGKTVSAERVFDVFVHANPDLGGYIEAQFGKRYEKLSVADKNALAGLIGAKLGVDKLADDINHGRIRATELVFAAEGKASGVLPGQGEQPEKTVLLTIKEKLHRAGDHLMHPLSHGEQPPAKTFVERYARVPASQAGYIRQMEEARLNEAQAATQR